MQIPGWITAFGLVALGLVAFFTMSIGQWVWPGIAGLLLVWLIWLYRRNGEHDLLVMLMRGAVILLPILLVALAIIIPLLSLDDARLDIRLKQAVLTGLIVVLGWLTTFAFQQERQSRDRRDREIDVLLALRAEILNFIWKFQDRDLSAEVKMWQQIAEQGLPESAPEGSQPRIYDLGDKGKEAAFHYQQAAPIVFQSLVSDLPLTNDHTLAEIVQFYAQLQDIVQASEDLKGADFAAFPLRMRASNIARFYEMHETAVALGQRAVLAIQNIVPAERLEAIQVATLELDRVMSQSQIQQEAAL